MARQSTIVQVFVASPSDVAEERAILEAVILQLNQIWSRTLRLSFELIKWETSTRPAAASDPQTAINDQVGSDYDVLIGIFWGRLGSATPRAVSGTVEEIERAYSRLQRDGAAPEIMLYFKDAPIAPSKIDPEQLRGLQEFKRLLSLRGTLYSNFEDLAGFESSLRAHLSAVAQKFAAAATTSPVVAQPTLDRDAEQGEDDEDLGYIDHIEIYEAKIADMIMALDVINQATVRVGEQLQQRSTELQHGRINDAKAARRFVKRAADDMDSYATIMSVQVSILSSARVAAMNALSNALALRGDFVGSDDEDLRNLRNTLASLAEGTTTAANGMIGMRAATSGLPRISKELNRAKRSVVSQLDAFLSEIESTRSTVNNIVEAIDRLLPRH